MSALEGKDILVIGARTGGYGESIARAAVRAGARVFGTTLDPEDPREKAFFSDLGAVLLDVPLVYNSAETDRVSDQLAVIETRLKELGVSRLHAVVHAVAGGFPRHPSVMKAVGDILKGIHAFSDMATLVKRNVYYVNAGSFYDTVRGMPSLIDEKTHLIALTYRGDLPYFIADSKRYLERLALRLADQGRRTLIAALPEAWTQSSQFFTGIEIAVLHNYLNELRGDAELVEELRPAFFKMEESLASLEGFGALVQDMRGFLVDTWKGISPSVNQAELYGAVSSLFFKLRKEGRFPILRRAVESISEFVREASGYIVVREFIAGEKYDAGDVRQVYYGDLKGLTPIRAVEPPERSAKTAPRIRKWVEFGRDEIRRTLSMYGDNFLFPQRIVMEAPEHGDAKLGFCTLMVPTPEENPIMRDHFVGMPLFGGHLQMEAVAQFGTFIVLKALEGKRLFPILTGTEFPDLNTMAPPGEKLTIIGELYVPDKRVLTFNAVIENRFARSKGVIRGMLISDRVLRKMMSSFFSTDEQENA